MTEQHFNTLKKNKTYNSDIFPSRNSCLSSCNYSIEDLLGVDQLGTIFKNLSQMTGLNMKLTSFPDQKVLASTIQSDICAKFLRKNPKSAKYCHEHNFQLTSQFTKPKEYKIRTCPHGLIYGVTPVIIKGNHIADFYIGPFLFQKENIDIIRQQAQHYNFNVDDYIQAIRKVPVFNKEQIIALLSLQAEIASMFAIQMLNHIDIREGAEKLEKEIIQHKQAVKQLKDVQQELESIFDNSQVGIMLLKGGRFFAKGNQRLADILGYDSPTEMLGMNMRALHISEENFIEYGKKYYNSLIEGEQIQIEYQLKRKDGTPVWCTLSGKAIDTDVPPDLEKGVLWMVDDITEKKMAELKLKQLATTDPLTNLFNRRSFFELAEREFEREKRYRNGLSLMLIDADHFKMINDTYGHNIGDKVLISFANTGRELIRNVDIFARIGGEEFAIILPSTTIMKAVGIAERIRKKVTAISIPTEQGKVNFTVSIGVSSYCRETSSVEDLLMQADMALYNAKNKGRNSVEFL